MPDFEEVYRLYFADVYKYILALSRDGAVAEEITNGTSSTPFSPASNCTRGQIVTFLYRDRVG